jgi:hypothetical protein
MFYMRLLQVYRWIKYTLFETVCCINRKIFSKNYRVCGSDVTNSLVVLYHFCRRFKDPKVFQWDRTLWMLCRQFIVIFVFIWGVSPDGEEYEACWYPSFWIWVSQECLSRFVNCVYDSNARTLNVPREPGWRSLYRDYAMGWKFRVSNPGSAMIFFPKRPHMLWDKPNFLWNGCRVLFPGVKRQKREVNQSPPSSAEVRNKWGFSPSSSVSPCR